ncbi:hypothetical protein GPECTOR_57g461 [Gonium pectorale]|uniref:Uncharacterized protein n=1 Tax=Gonium pectorale TaxID=33097 RepID=A0A150G5R5_GONPE|nr:hypothetical protein GPECTOR_57g461 [Gonium pectorale]|eukprot:KXZ45171.1 hypothetical protein GPECTOR_57g461 [Gonium pectorale]
MTLGFCSKKQLIRDALSASDARLKAAKSGRLAADLQPQQGAIMLQEWEGLAAIGDLDQGDSFASDNPQFQQMRAALLTFERELAYSAPARERAFFSALRAQLMEASVQSEEEQRNMHIAATYKWFSRHKPQGPEADPITAAVLASSLSVEAVAAPAAPLPPSERRLSAQGLTPRLQAAHAAATAATTSSGAFAAIGPGTQVKHQFFDVYSKAPLGGGVSAGGGGGGLSPGAAPASSAAAAAAGGSRPLSARGHSPGFRSFGRSQEGGGGGGGGGTSASVNHPLVMHPTVASAHSTRALAGGLPPPSAASAAAAAGISPSQPRARFTSTELYAPGKLVRPQELDELDHRAAQVAAAAAVAGADGMGGRGAGAVHARPWIPGPHKSTIGSGGAFAGKSGGGGPKAKTDEDAEARALRERWSTMDSKASQSVADVQNKMAEWTLQRARLEEEIVRRQEAARFAPASGGAAGHWRHAADMQQNGTDDGTLLTGALSPYANANADLAAATAAAAGSSSFLSGGQSVSFLLQPSGGGSAAAAAIGASMRMRHADIGTYDRNRPGSVRATGAAAKKKRSKSAGKKRPTSGR